MGIMIDTPKIHSAWKLNFFILTVNYNVACRSGISMFIGGCTRVISLITKLNMLFGEGLFSFRQWSFIFAPWDCGWRISRNWASQCQCLINKKRWYFWSYGCCWFFWKQNKLHWWLTTAWKISSNDFTSALLSTITLLVAVASPCLLVALQE